MSTEMISNPDIRFGSIGNYNSAMDRIGSKHPSRLFIREWMSHRSIDSDRLSERMECSPGTVSKLLNGNMKMTTEWLARIADALDTSVPDLFRDPKTPTADELLRGATPARRTDILNVVEALMKNAG